MINKKVFITWISCSLILAVGIHYLDGLPEIDDWFTVSFGVVSGVILLLVASIFLSFIISVIQLRAKNNVTVHRIRVFMPFSLVSLTILALVTFVLTRPSYSKSTPAGAWACNTIRNGIFLLDDYRIERRDNIQIETDITTDEKATFTVEWISDCEYKLINTKDFNDTAMVKITEVTDNVYKCVAKYGGRITEHVLSIQRNGN